MQQGFAAAEGFFVPGANIGGTRREGDSMTGANTSLPHPHVLMDAALFLMTKHAQSRCPCICHPVAQQFAWLAHHPAGDISAEKRALYRALAQQWNAMAWGGDAASEAREAGRYLQ